MTASPGLPVGADTSVSSGGRKYLAVEVWPRVSVQDAEKYSSVKGMKYEPPSG